MFIIPSLKLTAKHLKMDGCNRIVSLPIFRCELLVLGTVTTKLERLNLTYWLPFPSKSPGFQRHFKCRPSLQRSLSNYGIFCTVFQHLLSHFSKLSLRDDMAYFLGLGIPKNYKASICYWLGATSKIIINQYIDDLNHTTQKDVKPPWKK